MTSRILLSMEYRLSFVWIFFSKLIVLLQNLVVFVMFHAFSIIVMQPWEPLVPVGYHTDFPTDSAKQSIFIK